MHCGIHKTGTSYLQLVLKSNAKVLARHGIHYPVAPNPYIQRTGNHSIIASNYQPAFDVTEHFQKHVSLDSPARHLLISGEEFARLLPRAEFLKRFIQATAGADLKFVFYLRRHDHLRESVYAQSVKHSLYGDITKAQFNFDFFETVRPFVEAVGKQNVIVRPYNRKLWTGGDLCADFFTTIGRPEILPSLELTDLNYINPSLPRQHTFLLSCLKTPVAKARLLAFFESHELPGDQDGSRFFMSPLERRDFRALHAPSAQTMASLFGISDVNEFLGVHETERDEEWAPFSPNWQRLSDYMSAFADWDGKS